MADVTIFKPGVVNIQGMYSSVDQASLPEGAFGLLENLLVERFAATPRAGAARLSLVPTTGLSYRGHWCGFVESPIYGTQERCYAAFWDGTDTRIYELSLTGFTWTELTSTGPPNTRFDANADVDFVAVWNVQITDDPSTERSDTHILCLNGVDNPRYLFLSGATTTGVGVIATIGAQPSSGFTSRPIPSTYFNIKDPANTTYVNSGANLTLADSGATSGNNEANGSFGAATAVADTTEIQFAASSCRKMPRANVSGSTVNGLDLSECAQVGIVFSDGNITDPILNYLDVEVYDGSAYRLIHRATGDDTAGVIYESMGGSYYTAFIQLGQAVVRSSLTSCPRIRFIARRTMTVTRTFKISAIFGTGLIPFGATYRGSYTETGAYVETGSRVFEILPASPISEYGASSTLGYPMPYAEGVHYRQQLQFPSGTAYTGLTGASWSERLMVYRKDPGDEDWFYTLLAPWATSGGVATFYYDYQEPATKFYGRSAPSAFVYSSFPLGGTGAFAGRRLFMARMPNQNSTVLVSQERHPLRFESIPGDKDEDGAIDDDSGMIIKFPGENVQALVTMPGSMIGAGPVATFTDKGVWRHETASAYSLVSPTQISPEGTLFRRTIATNRGSIYYLDSMRMPRRIDSGLNDQNLGVWRIEDQIEEGDAQKATGFVFKDRYYLAFRGPSQTVNQRVMVYEQNMDGWFRHSYQVNFAGYFAHTQSATIGKRLCGITETGAVFHVEQPGKAADDQQSGSSTDAVAVALTTGELASGADEPADFGSVWIYCDKTAGAATATVTWTDLRDSANEGITSGTINLNVGTDRIFRYATNSTTGGDLGISASAAKLQVSITGMVNGEKLRGIFAKIEPRQGRGGPDRS